MKEENVELSKYESRLMEFETAWQTNKPPDIKMFAVDGDGSQQPFLIELAKIDLEHRLRNGIEADAQTYPDCFPLLRNEDVQWDLVECEFRLRTRFGRPLTDSQIDARFGDQADQVRQLVKTSESTYASISTLAPGVRGDLEINFRAGSRVNQYTIKGPLGSGTFAVVYAAKDNELGRLVALKFLRPQMAGGAGGRARSLREAQAVAALNHPNIAAVFETGTYNEIDYIAGQFVEGQSMDRLLAGQSFSIKQSVELVQKLAGALAHAHAQGVVHRDIKPANVMIENGSPMLLDFGLARLDDASVQLTNAGDVLGTPAYMPPEQADGRAWQADPRSDVYSLGALLYRLTCEKLPFEGSTVQVVHSVIHQVPASPRRHNRKMPRDLETIVLKCLEKDPADRYQTAQALESDLGNFLAGDSIQARPAGIAGTVFKWSKRKPAMAAMIAILLIGAAFLVGIGSQLVRVSLERDRANMAESKLQKLLADEAANAGRLSMQRGRPADAVGHFNKSLQMGYADPVDLRLRIVEATVATRQLHRAEREIIKLTKDHPTTTVDRPQVQSRLGEIYVWQALLSLDQIGTFGEPVELLEKARAHELPDSAKYFVDAMLAETSLESLAHFRQALVADPFHHQARHMLIIMLISLARFDEALIETNTARQLYPEDTDFVLFHAIIMGTRGELEACRKAINSTDLEPETAEKWMDFCRTVDQVANQLVIHAGSLGYDQSTIDQVVRRFAERHLPLLVERGWHFPPAIAPRIGRLFDDILIVTSAETINVDDARKTVELLKQLVDVHPEGSLLSLYAERAVKLNNLQAAAGGLQSADPQLLQLSLDAFQRSIEQPGFVKSVPTTNWIGILGSSLTLAHIHKIEQDKNLSRFVNAAGQFDPREMRLSRNGIRGIVITLLNRKAYDEAVPWCDRWIELVGEDDFDAVWHRLMIDRWRMRWYDVLKRCNAAIDRFPDKQTLKDLRTAAIAELEKEIKSPAKGTGDK